MLSVFYEREDLQMKDHVWFQSKVLESSKPKCTYIETSSG